MTITHQRPFEEILSTAETTAIVLEMIGCFFENTDKERWSENAIALSELAYQQSRRLRAVQGHISDLEDKAYEYDLMNKAQSSV